MSASVAPASALPWWKEPTKDQWYAYFAAWMGWTLDAFDFTVFLLIMAPIAQEFGVPLIDVTAVFSVTLIMRLGGATASGWLADRMGRRAPLMISILWYSICNLAAGLSPTFTFLFVARALLGIGMGAEWPAGAALAMESWPVRSRGFMSGVLPALACVWIRVYVKEPKVWAENKKIQDTTRHQVTLPLFMIFKPKYLWNTITGCVWMGANFCVYYAIWAMLGTYLQKELGWTPAQVSVPVFWGNIITFLACAFWGGLSERIGRRWALMIPCTISILLVPIYLRTTDPTWFLMTFMLFICFVGGKDALNPGWLSERFPTEVRATAAGFVYHQGAIWGAAVAPVLTYFAVNQGMGFAQPMMYATIGSLVVYVIAVFLGPETKGKVMTADLEVIKVEVAT